jgi:hypothetical protein
MRKYITLFFSVTFFLFACKGGKSPGDVIKHDQMVSLLTDMHIVDGSLYNIQQVPDSLYKYGESSYLNMFKKHHTDSAQFRTSLRYYATKPLELQAMYDQVLINLKQKTDSLNKSQRKDALP